MKDLRELKDFDDTRCKTRTSSQAGGARAHHIAPQPGCVYVCRQGILVLENIPEKFKCIVVLQNSTHFRTRFKVPLSRK